MKTREINNKHYINAKVVMLDSNKKAVLYLDSKGIFSKNRIDNSILYHNLYITSNEEIKEGDWWYNTHNNYISNEIVVDYGVNKKIIATTDSSLTINRRDSYLGKVYDYLPQPSKEFIQSYIESYNNGNVIEDVLVEVENNYKPTGIKGELYKENQFKFCIKLKDNTIIIKKKEDDWDDVEEAYTDYELDYIEGDRTENVLMYEEWLKKYYNVPTRIK